MTESQTLPSKQVRVRFAPSPTGFLHIGNTRTALFNWIYARQNKGVFILRMDDTDLQRSEERYVEAIKEDLQWLGFHWDEYYQQKERSALYQKAKMLLLFTGRLYPCWETPEELDHQRKLLLAQRKPPLYNRHGWFQWKKFLEEKKVHFLPWGEHQNQNFSTFLQEEHFRKNNECSSQDLFLHEDNFLTLMKEFQKIVGQEEKSPHWRFFLHSDSCLWQDAVQGEQKISPRHFSDPVVIREDGNIGYLLASVVDDIDMGITHVIRGSDHISNTAVQIQLFQWLHHDKMPKFCHFPLLSSLGGQKLSKRLGSLNIQQLRQEGFCPQVILGALGNLGSQNSIDITPNFLENFTKGFSFSHYTKSNVQFDEDSLLHYQEIFMHHLSYEDFCRLCPKDLQVPQNQWMLLRENILYFQELKQWSEILNHDAFWFAQHYTEDLELPKGKFSLEKAQLLWNLGREAIEKEEDLVSFVMYHKPMDTTILSSGNISVPLEKKDMAMILRLGLTGQPKGPKLQELASFFWKKSK